MVPKVPLSSPIAANKPERYPLSGFFYFLKYLRTPGPKPGAMAVLGTSVQYQRPELINAVSSAAGRFASSTITSPSGSSRGSSSAAS